MSKKTRKLKAKIDILRSDINYHKSNIRLLLNKPTETQIEELKFQYGDFNYNLVAGRQPDQNKIGAGIYDHFAEKKVELHKFPKEEMESREYHVSKHAPVSVLDNKNFFFGLPEHWYIRVTQDNVGLLNEYLKSHKDRYEKYQDTWYVDNQWIDGDNCAFFHSASKEAAHTTPTFSDGYTEVTTEMVENYMKKWNQIQSFNLVDKSWLEFKKENAKNAGEQLAKQTDVNKDGCIGNTPNYSPEHLEAKKALFDSNDVNVDNMKLELSEEDKKAIVESIKEKKEILKIKKDFYDKYFKETIDRAFEARTQKVPDRWVVVKVKEGSIIISPDVKGITMVKGMPTQDPIHIGDLGKCADQECKPIKQEYEKTLDNVAKINAFIGTGEPNSISKGNKDMIFKKTAEWDSERGSTIYFYNIATPVLKYTISEMLSDWKSNYVKPLD